MARDPLLPPSGPIRRGGRWRPVGWLREEGDGGSNGGTEDGGRRRAAFVQVTSSAVKALPLKDVAFSPITRNRIFGATSPVRGAKRGPRRQNETLVLRLARELVTPGERSAAALWRAEPRTAWLRAPRRRGERGEKASSTKREWEGVVDGERGRRR